MQNGLQVSGDKSGCWRAMEFTMILQAEHPGVVATEGDRRRPKGGRVAAPYMLRFGSVEAWMGSLSHP
jgi:hypothetical protein